MKILLAVMCSFFLLTADAQQNFLNESKPDRDTRMEWWRDATFGMFIHWGAYAVPAGSYNGKEYGRIGEWIMHSANIPIPA